MPDPNQTVPAVDPSEIETQTTGRLKARLEEAVARDARVAARMEATEKLPQPTLPGVDPIMQYFAYEHLPPALQVVSRPWCELAKSLVDPNSPQCLPRSAERSVALRKLLEGKDAAVRAALSTPGPG